MTEGELHSTGRGGSGNIGKGEGEYADPVILSDGKPVPKTLPEEHSTGRGGQGNILADPGVKGGDEPLEDGSRYADFHTGRGGEGNVHREKYGGHSKEQKQKEKEKEHGFMEKAKHAVGLDRK